MGQVGNDDFGRFLVQTLTENTDDHSALVLVLGRDKAAKGGPETGF